MGRKPAFLNRQDKYEKSNAAHPAWCWLSGHQSLKLSIIQEKGQEELLTISPAFPQDLPLLPHLIVLIFPRSLGPRVRKPLMDGDKGSDEYLFMAAFFNF